VVLFSVIAGSGPALWVLHNTLRFGNPIEFYNGPYSAQAIYAHQLATTGFRYPTEGSWLLSARYYVEDLKLVIGAWPLELAVLGLVAIWPFTRLVHAWAVPIGVLWQPSRSRTSATGPTGPRPGDVCPLAYPRPRTDGEPVRGRAASASPAGAEEDDHDEGETGRGGVPGAQADRGNRSVAQSAGAR